tara:strand:- start:4659 stop:5771 length:1113 start_codon:yes stop_codon:yes gene_type:complete
MTRIGIGVKQYESMFVNGCVQQALFIYKMLNNIEGFQCDFVTAEPDYKVFDSLIPIEVILLTEENMKNYDVITPLSLTINKETTPWIIDWMKIYNVKYVDILCGNLYILLQEEFVFNIHHIMKNYRNDAIDEIWVLEMYSYAKEYLELVYNRPVKILKYVWDPDIIKAYLHTKQIKIERHPDTSKINICVYEANMSLHKNAYIPLLMADKFYQLYPERLNKVFIFCKELKTMKNNGFYEKLDIVKSGKIEFHGRLIMPETLRLIQQMDPYKNVVLSHTHLNNLNFLHLELLYMGVPIVHNCEPFQNGFYFDTYNMHRGIQLLEKARITKVSQLDNIDILCKFSSKNVTIQNEWKKNIKRLCETDETDETE